MKVNPEKNTIEGESESEREKENVRVREEDIERGV